MAHSTSNIIRGYELQERLGEGGFGAVYRAFQPAVAREVAVKVILPQYANQPEFIRRFEAEAQLVARLEHPHIVPLYDFWRDPDGAYLVMRYVRGGNLRYALNSNILNTDKTLTILEQTAAALDTAHRHQVVHRDVKPDNILLDEDGNAYLSDFGIAQMLKSGSTTEKDSEEDTLTGSLGYISPEQVRGDPLTRRSDIYSLAVIAYELLTGKHPFYQFSPTVQMVKHLTDDLPPVVHFRSDLPTTVDEVIKRATLKQPAGRYETAGEFIQALKLAVGKAAPAQATPSEPAQTISLFEESNPYKGLRPFEEADAEDFFGREALVRKLIERLETPTTLKGSAKQRVLEPFRFLAVVGPSGSGKSSVVKAGLVPALRRGFLPGSSQWVITQMVPGDNPFEQLEHELLSVAARPIKDLRERLRASDHGLQDIIPELLVDLNTEILLVIDQFEEVFTARIDEKERIRFLENIRWAVTNAESRLRVIITLRADFYDRPLSYAGFGTLLQQRTEVVLPLTANELAQAIVAPAERVGVALERGLAIDIATEVTDQPGALPLLQYALTELFDRREGHVMNRAAYRKLGGVMGALTRRADEVYKQLNPQEQEAAKALFQRLVTLGEGTGDTRRRVLRAELDSLSPLTGQIVDCFGKARLLSYDRDPLTRTPTVEVAHEALIHSWEALREWLSENRESIRTQIHLTQAAREWNEHGCDAGDLYRGGRLAQVKEWAEAHPNEINQLEREFLAASMAQAEVEATEREAQRQRELEAAQKLAESEKARAEEQTQAAERLRRRGEWLGVALLLVIFFLFMAGWLGYQANKQRIQAEQNFLQSERLRLAAQASANLLSGTDRETAPLLSIASLNLGYTTEADLTLQRAMTYPYPKHILAGHAGSIYAVAYSPDSRTIATASTDWSIILWDAASGQALRILEGHTNSVASLAFSPDGSKLVSASEDKTVRVWEVASGAELLKLEGHQDIIWGVAFAPDGKKIASVSYDKTIRVWEAQSGNPLVTINIPEATNAIDYSPDSQLVLIGGEDGAARLYNAGNGQLVREFTGHQQAVVSVHFSHNGLYLATGSDDTTVTVWYVDNAEPIVTLAGHKEAVYGLDFSSDDRYLVTASYDRDALVWDWRAKAVIRRLSGHTGSLYSVAISHDDRQVVTGSFDATARLWPSGLQADPRMFRHAASVMTLDISPDGKTLGTGSASGEAFLWDATTGGLTHRLSGHDYSIESLAFSPDGTYVATSGDDFTVRLWIASTGDQVRTLEVFSTAIWAVRFSPDGKTLLTASDDGLRLWNVRSGALIHQIAGNQAFYAAQFSPDGKYVLAGGNYGLFLYESGSGKITARLAPPDERGIFAVAITPNGQYAVAGGGELVLMEFPSLKVIQTLKGHTGSILSTTFSPASDLLLSGSDDGTARVWDLTSFQTVRVLSTQQALTNNAAFALEGKQVYVGGADNTVWMWDLDFQELIHYACQVVGRDLTADERQKYGLANSAPVCGP